MIHYRYVLSITQCKNVEDCQRGSSDKDSDGCQKLVWTFRPGQSVLCCLPLNVYHTSVQAVIGLGDLWARGEVSNRFSKYKLPHVIICTLVSLLGTIWQLLITDLRLSHDCPPEQSGSLSTTYPSVQTLRDWRGVQREGDQ